MYEELPGAKGNPFRSRVTSLSGVSVLSVMTTPDKAYRWWYRWTNYASVTAKTPPARTDASADRAGIRGTVTMPPADPAPPRRSRPTTSSSPGTARYRDVIRHVGQLGSLTPNFTNADHPDLRQPRVTL